MKLAIRHTNEEERRINDMMNLKKILPKGVSIFMVAACVYLTVVAAFNIWIMRTYASSLYDEDEEEIYE